MAQGTRVPIRIYRMPSSTAQAPTIKHPPSGMLLGKTTANITPDKKIEVTSFNLPGAALSSWGFATHILDVNSLEGDEQGPMVLVTDDNKQPLKFYIASVTASGGATSDVFEFLINPQRIEPVYNKRITEVLTRGGYEIQHWGNALTEVRVTGRSGGLNKNPQGGFLEAQDTVDVTQSLAWKRLASLREWYIADHATPNQEDPTLICMNFYDKFLMGYFTTFTGPVADAEKPYIVDFSFTLKVQKELNI